MQLFEIWLSVLSAFDWLIVAEGCPGTDCQTSLSEFFSFVLVDLLCSQLALHPHREPVSRPLAGMSVRTVNESG